MLVLCAWPLRDALLQGRAPGAGPDVVSTLWGMWWLQQTGPSALVGAQTSLVNFPEGATGSVLSPLGALSWALSEPLLGLGGASCLVGLEMTAGFALAVALLGSTLGLGRAAVLAAGLSALVGRVLFFALGEGSAVATAALPVPLGLAAMLAPADRWRSWLRLGFAACMVGAAAENPYLAPVLPGVGVLRLGWLGRQGRWDEVRPLLWALGVGSLGILGVAAVFGRSADPNYPGEIANRSVMLGPLRMLVVDMPWSRALPSELLVPGAVRWTLDVDGGAMAGGGRYLGLSVLALAGWGLWRDRARAWPWGLLAAVCALLGMGSLLPGGLAGPFLFLNALMDLVARPLTQPTRFLVVAQVGLAVAAALGVQALGRRARAVAVGALAADALLLGGLSLRLPTLTVPGDACFSRWFEENPGAVLLWPWDAVDTDASPSQLYQMAHGQPAAHRGIASWRLPGEVGIRRLRGLGWRIQGVGVPMEVEWAALQRAGFRWVVVEQDPQDARVAELDKLLGPARADCGAQRVYAVPER